MTSDPQSLRAALAVNRFGLGARDGDIEDAAPDPKAWLVAQIRREGADQPRAYPLPARLRAAPAAPDLAGGGAPAAAPTAAGSATAAAMPGAACGPLDPPPPAPEFTEGAELPTMAKAFQSLQAARRTAAEAKGDPEARKAALASSRADVGEDILARVRLGAATPAGFRERWALFWANHFTVAAKNIQTAAAAGPFEREAIRPYVFARFEDLLIAATSHPGMLLYLDQAQSIGPLSEAAQRRGGRGGLNENLGREVLELHTVGADAGYTQADVTEFARALTGWSIGGRNAPQADQGRFLFRPEFHEPGPRSVMGKLYPAGGRDQAVRVLKDLAADRKTADRLSLKIARHFVADDPPPEIVARLSQSYQRSGGDLAHVAAALVAAPEAWDPSPRKFKTPYEFFISSHRAAGYLPQDPAREIVQPLTALGMRPFSAPQPNGWSELAVDWAAPDAVVKRLTWAQAFADGHASEQTPLQAVRAALGGAVSQRTLTAISRAESRPEAFALLLMSPEFQRR
jgi:uncharacterized protein (DUF1800 family)